MQFFFSILDYRSSWQHGAFWKYSRVSTYSLSCRCTVTHSHLYYDIACYISWLGFYIKCVLAMHIDIFRHDTRMLHTYYYNLCRRGTIIIFVRGSDLFYLRQKYVNRSMRIVCVLSGRESIVIIYIYMRMYEYMIVILLNYRFKGIDHTTAVNRVPI